MNSRSFLEKVIVVDFEFASPFVRHAGEYGRKYRYLTGFRCLFEFVHKVHIFVRVYLDAGGSGCLRRPKRGQYFSDYPPRTSLLFLSGPLLYSQPRKRILCSCSLELAEADNILYVADRRDKFVNRFMPVVSGSVEAVEGEPGPVHLCPLQRLFLRIQKGVVLALGAPRRPVLVPRPREPLLRLVVANRDRVLDLDSLTPVAPPFQEQNFVFVDPAPLLGGGDDLLTRLFHRSVRC